MTRPDEFACTVEGCGRTFNRASKLQDHLNAHLGIRPHVCNECQKTFTRADHLARHVISTHTKAFPFSCPRCEKKFSLKHQLVRHLRVHDSDNDSARPSGEFKCETCQKSFSSKKCLIKHEKRHAKIYSCLVCQQVFPTWSALLEHRKSHKSNESDTTTGDVVKRVYKCDECEKILSSRYSLQVHKRTVHQGLRPFECAKCGETFGHKHLMTRHCRTCQL